MKDASEIAPPTNGGHQNVILTPADKWVLLRMDEIRQQLDVLGSELLTPAEMTKMIFAALGSMLQKLLEQRQGKIIVP